MSDDFARTQAQIAAQAHATAPRSAVHAPDVSQVVPAPTRRSEPPTARDGHERTGMVPRDPIDPTPDNLRNLED